MTELYVAKLTTRNFHFEAYGESESQAQAALLRGLKLHQWQYPHAKIRELIGDVEVHQVFLGECYRDHEQLKPREKRA